MPSRYRRDAPSLRAEIVAWVDAGDLLKGGDAQISKHGRARRQAFDQALADRIVVRLPLASPAFATAARDTETEKPGSLPARG